jgi:uncharacterized protein (DUF1800 family)
MIITHLLGHNKWITAWTESGVELAGNERQRRAAKQKAPEARQRRARNERRAATRNAHRNNKGFHHQTQYQFNLIFVLSIKTNIVLVLCCFMYDILC